MRQFSKAYQGKLGQKTADGSQAKTKSAWIFLGEFSCKVMKMELELAIAQVADFEDLKKVIKVAYGAWLLR